MKIFTKPLLTILLTFSTVLAAASTGAGNGQLMVKVNSKWAPIEYGLADRTDVYYGSNELPVTGKYNYAKSMFQWLSRISKISPQLYKDLLSVANSTSFVFVHGELAFRAEDYNDLPVKFDEWLETAIYKNNKIYVSTTNMSKTGTQDNLSKFDLQGITMIHELINAANVKLWSRIYNDSQKIRLGQHIMELKSKNVAPHVFLSRIYLEGFTRQVSSESIDPFIYRDALRRVIDFYGIDSRHVAIENYYNVNSYIYWSEREDTSVKSIRTFADYVLYHLAIQFRNDFCIDREAKLEDECEQTKLQNANTFVHLDLENFNGEINDKFFKSIPVKPNPDEEFLGMSHLEFVRGTVFNSIEVYHWKCLSVIRFTSFKGCKAFYETVSSNYKSYKKIHLNAKPSKSTKRIFNSMKNAYSMYNDIFYNYETVRLDKLNDLVSKALEVKNKPRMENCYRNYGYENIDSWFYSSLCFSHKEEGYFANALEQHKAIVQEHLNERCLAEIGVQCQQKIKSINHIDSDNKFIYYNSSRAQPGDKYRIKVLEDFTNGGVSFSKEQVFEVKLSNKIDLEKIKAKFIDGPYGKLRLNIFEKPKSIPSSLLLTLKNGFIESSNLETLMVLPID